MKTKDIISQIVEIQKNTIQKLKYNNDVLFSLSGLINFYQKNSLKNDQINIEMIDLFINYLLDETIGEEKELLNEVDHTLDLIIN